MRYKAAFHNGAEITTDEAAQIEDELSRKHLGLFETMLYEHGQIFLWQQHIERLQQGLKSLQWAASPLHQEEYLIQAIQDMLCTLAAGTYKIRMFLFPKDVLISINILEEEVTLSQGLKVGLYKLPESYNRQHAHLKTTDRLHYQQAASLGTSLGMDDMFMARGKFILETTICNIFWVKNGQVFTTPTYNGAVQGTMQHFLITRLKAMDITVGIQQPTIDSLYLADEIWLTNAVRKMGFVKCTDRSWHGFNLGQDVKAKLAASN